MVDAWIKPPRWCILIYVLVVYEVQALPLILLLDAIMGCLATAYDLDCLDYFSSSSSASALPRRQEGGAAALPLATCSTALLSTV